MLFERPVSLAPHFLVSEPRCSQAHGDASGCSYRVAWSINPHMRIGAANPRVAARQHAALVGLLRRLGARVTVVPFVHGAHDSVFVKDCAVLHGPTRRALLAHPRHDVRRSEIGARRAALGALGLDVVDAPRSPLEGGDVITLGSGAFLGYGFRSSCASAPRLERFLDAPVTPLKLVDPRLYHLDMAMAVLTDGTALVCSEAFDPESLRRIEASAHIRRVLDVPKEEALAFGANVVQVGRDVVLGGRAPRTARALGALGYRTHVPGLSEFHKAGGSAACLVASFHLDSSVEKVGGDAAA